jgi:transcriptional regulator with XRE-family HTH domain
MDIARRLRELREDKEMSQGDIEKKTGLFRCCISRVENGHTVPAIENLEKMVRDLDVPLHGLFYEGTNAVEKVEEEDDWHDWATSRPGSGQFRKLRQALARISAADRKMLMFMAEKIVTGRSKE